MSKALTMIDVGNSRESEQSMREQAKEIAESCKRMGKKANSSKFPDFLWTVQINEFINDDYRIRGACEDPSVQKAYTIRAQYGDIWDYMEALQLYYDYVEYINEAYGSFEMVQAAVNDGLIELYIPYKPEIKHKKKLQRLLKAGFLPSKIEDDSVDYDTLEMVIDKLPKGKMIDDPTLEQPEVYKNLWEKGTVALDQQLRVGGLYKITGQYASSSTDAIINFMQSANTTAIEDRNKEYSFTDELNSYHEFDGYTNEQVEEILTPKTNIIADGMLFSAHKSQNPDEIKIYKVLEDNGFDIFTDADANRVGKAAQRVIVGAEARVPDFSSMTKKQKKKFLKKQKKLQNKLAAKNVGDQRLQSALLANRLSNSDFATMMNTPLEDALTDQKFLDFHFSDVFRE